MQVCASFDSSVHFSNLFQGLGKIKYSYKTNVKPDVVPSVTSIPRRVSLPLMIAAKKELDDMQGE